jgi:hypothetical protein
MKKAIEDDVYAGGCLCLVNITEVSGTKQLHR